MEETNSYVLNYMTLAQQEQVLTLANKDKDVMWLLISANETLIWHTIRKYVGDVDNIVRTYTVDRDDLLQLGRLGFIKSAKAFDSSRGLRFSTFAVPTITREVRCFLRDNGGMIRPTRRASELLYRIQLVEKDIGILPPLEELVEMVDASLPDVIKAIRIGRVVRYLDVPIPTEYDGVISFTETLRDDYELENELVDLMYEDEIMSRLRSMLTEREQAILKERLTGKNNKEIAKDLKLSTMKVNRVMKRIGIIFSNATGIRPTFITTRKERDSKYEKYIRLVANLLNERKDAATVDIRRLLKSNGLEHSLPLSTIYHIRKKACNLLDSEGSN